jgi:hypothetical protein
VVARALQSRTFMIRTTFTLGCALFVACSSTTPSSSPAVGNASAQQIEACKHGGCDKMKFFGCTSAEEQAACYSDCDNASSNQIELFTSCAEASVCDPACRTNIVPKPPSGGGGGGSVSGGGSGASAPSCGAACDKLVSCSFIRVGDKSACVSQCAKQAYQYQIDCVNATACDKMKSTCGDPVGSGTPGDNHVESDAGHDDSFAIYQCQSACDTLSFFACIDAAAHETCRSQCTTAAANKRDSFTACANGAGGDCARGADCYGQFRP